MFGGTKDREVEKDIYRGMQIYRKKRREKR